MKTLLAISLAIGSTGFATAAFAQTGWTPGSEIVGQAVQVQADGVTDTIYFDTATSQRIVTPGSNSVAGAWAAANQQLCLLVQGIQECWPYTAPFQAGVPVTLTSLTTSKVSTWTALATNAAPPAGAPVERGK